MRLAVAGRGETANAYYRLELPLKTLATRGHRVDWHMQNALRAAWEGRPGYELMHIHQFISEEDLALIERLAALGVAVVWDTDDDVLGTPKFSPVYKEIGGRRKIKKRWELAVRIAKASHLVTTPSPVLADTYRDAGVEHVQVIENYVANGDVGGRRAARDIVTIGYVAGFEHQQDLDGHRIGETLARLLEDHPTVRVVSIGMPLDFRHHRYVSHGQIPVEELISRVREFDIGLAPLIDRRFNRARSNVKLKEYAAAGATWLASPIGPYVGMGAEEGGQLVGDGGWHAAIERLVLDRDRRLRLQAAASSWGRCQTISRAAGRWEAAFRGAIERASSHVAV